VGRRIDCEEAVECRRSGFEVVGGCHRIDEAAVLHHILKSEEEASNLEEHRHSHHEEEGGRSLEVGSRGAVVEHNGHRRDHEEGVIEVDSAHKDRLSLVEDLLHSGSLEAGSHHHHEQMEEACQIQL